MSRAELRPLGAAPLNEFEAARLRALAPEIDRISFDIKTRVFTGEDKSRFVDIPERVLLVLEAIEAELK